MWAPLARQVVVFSHDDLLAGSVRRLRRPATIWEVQRRERSVVEVQPNGDPVGRYLSDARALAANPDLPDDIRGELVATCCRSAVEAACHVAIRRAGLSRGETHAQVEKLIGDSPHDPQDRDAGRVRRPGARIGSAGQAPRRRPGGAGHLPELQEGRTAGLRGDLRPFLRDVEGLAAWLQQR